MALNKGKHTVAEIEGIRCTVVETGLNENRCLFLKGILEQNGYEVKAEKEKSKEGAQLETWVLGVTDIRFNPMITLFEQKLKRTDGNVVTQAYWNQWPADPDLPYWMVTK
jgi:hypothetical protein